MKGVTLAQLRNYFISIEILLRGQTSYKRCISKVALGAIKYDIPVPRELAHKCSANRVVGGRCIDVLKPLTEGHVSKL